MASRMNYPWEPDNWLSDIELSTRARVRLYHWADVRTKADLARLDMTEFRLLPGVGLKTYHEVLAVKNQLAEGATT